MKKEKICGIYKITSPSGRVYIGESIDIVKRFKNYNSLRCENQIKLYNSFLKHTVEEHIFEIIEECSVEDLKCRERHWQDFYDVIGDNGLNLKLTKCGELKMIHSEYTRKKISEANKGSIGRSGEDNPMYGLHGENNPNFGSKRTEEQRKNISDSLKGKMSGGNNPMYGKKHTEETCKKIKESLLSSALKGENHPNFGKKLKKETLDKLSKIRKGIHEGEKHPKSQRIINILTKEVFNCIKTFCQQNDVVYSTFVSKLRGNLRNDTDYVLHDDYLNNKINIDKTEKQRISVINIETNKVYNSIKEASIDYEGTYESLCYILKHSKNNKTNFRYYTTK